MKKLKLKTDTVRVINVRLLAEVRGGLDLTGNCDSATHVRDAGAGSRVR
jgi:hypothetical protein